MGNWQPFNGADASLGEANSVVAAGKARLDEMHNFTSKGLQVRVLGVPQQHAKSRVETQIKICLQLVTDKGDKVPLWSHLRLPEYLVPREKLRRNKMSDYDHMAAMSEKAVLNLEAVVVCASDVAKTVTTCLGCIQRERKRTRKKEANSKRAVKWEAPRLGPSGEELLDDESLSLEQKKVLLFNCSHMVDFSSGDTILPTRITCYCRHHGEKLGFCVYFVIRDCTGQIVATGMSPPIMITDDHKSSKAKANSRKRPRTDEPMSPPSGSSPPFRRSSVLSSQSNEQVPDAMSMMLGDSILSFGESNIGLGEQFMNHGHNIFPANPRPHSVAQPASPISPPQAVAFPKMDDLLANDETREHQACNGLDLNGEFGADMVMDLDNISRAADLAVFEDFMVQTGLQDPVEDAKAEAANTSAVTSQIPSVSRIVPAEGPLHGGLEVTVLGSDFYDGLTVMFGGIPAVQTHFWGATTLVCILPPAPVPGPVPVTFKEHPVNLSSESDNNAAIFTYKDDADRALMELALQVLGLRMTGKLEDARQIAMRIVADPNSGNKEPTSGATSSAQTRRSLAVSVLKQSFGVSPRVSRPELECLLLQALCNASDDQNLLDDTCTSTGHNLLHLAILSGMGSLAKWLIANEVCDIEASDQSGFAPIHFAAWTGMWSVVKELLEAGARRHVPIKQGHLPVHLAASRGHREVVKLLAVYQNVYDWDSDEGIFSGEEEESEQPVDESDVVVDPVVELHSECDMIVKEVPEHIPTDDADLKPDATDDVWLVPTSNEIGSAGKGSQARPVGRFAERPRRGKRGRGGRGGTGTLQRFSAGIREEVSVTSGKDETANEHWNAQEDDGSAISEKDGAHTAMTLAEPLQADPTLASANPEKAGDAHLVDESKAARLSVKELLYNLAAHPESKTAISQKVESLENPASNLWNKTEEKSPSSWYNPLAQLPTFLALPVSLPTPALQKKAEDKGSHGKNQIDDLSDRLPAVNTHLSPTDTSCIPPGDTPLPPYTPPVPYPQGINTLEPHQRGISRFYIQQHSPSVPSPYPSRSDSLDHLALLTNEYATDIPCNCISYSGTHETRCARYQAALERKKEMIYMMEGGRHGRSLWTFWIPVLFVVLGLAFFRFLVTNEDVETIMNKIGQAHADILGPVREWFEGARAWGAGRGEGVTEWIHTIHVRGRAIAKVGRLVV
ncbi:uncharacterized protein SPPG_06083 [Spizellomyces punctatus DAOM BR117]|uniref:IPT/TIG domain-containing protein n=1 Tax=Spizellomyces punctatus (strain DAOM BR117) TaxID=645134 RepID=A0A0L0H9Y8_SPIPD|nr:uncharacterized protein SPPG_06083 [Spizellomyces punctatus DAOM BR117]KNC98375.1 hypothetical protein SPPG_06083 [Spizellomyces punctatus DAOM BR117]|eukprot:XP_016606415.1 hypothetical protein SPPG_06083 [Spizellomyces punctatus DAOM BR117]